MLFEYGMPSALCFAWPRASGKALGSLHLFTLRAPQEHIILDQDSSILP